MVTASQVIELVDMEGAGRFVNSSATIRKGTSINLTVGAGGSRTNTNVLAGTLAGRFW
jgi:hypothetical protein